MRSHLAEFGIIAAVGDDGAKVVRAIAANGDPRVPAGAQVALGGFVTVLTAIETEIDRITAAIKAQLKTCETSMRLETIPGVGPLLATAIVATVGDAKVFKSGRSFSALSRSDAPHRRWA